MLKRVLNLRFPGLSSDSQAKQTKPVNEVIGVETLEIDDVEDTIQHEILTPWSSLRALHQQPHLQNNFLDWLESIQK